MKDFKQNVNLRRLLTGVMLCCASVEGGLASPDVSDLLSAPNDLTISLPQQSKITVKGTVLEPGGDGAIGANVSIKNSMQGTITDIDGNFSLDVSENDILVISYIGFMTQEVPVNGNSIINVTLKENSELLDEVVVVGYGVQKKVNVTGSIATVDAKTMEARPITNASSALAGLATGVDVRQTSGRPGADGAKIRIRGTGTIENSNDSRGGALVIVDGIEGELDAVNPNDIESISLLKDAASSAIYGSRAANGVILVTTKKGKKGKPQINFSATLSLAQPTMTPSFETNYARYMELFNESLSNLGQSVKYDQSLIDTWRAAEKNPNALNEFGYPNHIVYANTDWAKAMFENNWVQNYNLSVSGGGDNSRYSLSAGYLNNPGLMKNTGSERYQFRINAESTIANILTVGTNTFMSFQDDDMGETDDKLFNYIRQRHPGLYPYAYDGYWAQPSGNEKANPSLLKDLVTVGGKDQTSRINTSWFARVDIAKGLSFETKFNYQMMLRKRNAYPISYMTKNFATDVIIDIPQNPETMVTSYKEWKNYMITFDNVLRYNFDLNKIHSFGILVGHNEYYYNVSDYTFSKKGLIDEGMYVPGSAGETENRISGNEKDRGMRSFFGRVNYDYLSRYILELNLRYDGSSRFGSMKRWGTFPGVSVGWRISEENFMEPYRDFMPNLKVRASWGRLGNDAAGFYDYQAIYNKNGYVFGGKPVPGLAQNKMGNAYLHWEGTEVKDLAIEGNIFGGRMSFELDYYDKYTTGILATPAINNVAGNITGPTKNDSELRNRGIEITLGWKDRIGEVSYGVRGNFAYNKNRIVKYKGQYKINEDGTNNYGQVSGSVNGGAVVENHMMGEYYMRSIYKGDGSYYHRDGSINVYGGPKDGMIRTEQDLNWVLAMKDAGYSFSPVNNVSKSQMWYGDMIYADNNGDGVYGDSNDRIFTGKSMSPKYTYGFSADAAWNNFDFSMVWAGSASMYYHLMTIGYNSTVTMDSNGLSKWVVDDRYYYNEENPDDPRNNINGTYPRLTYNASSINETSSTRTLYNASYLKLKNLQLGYTIPAGLTKRVGMERVRVYVSGENLLTISPFKFFDPEIGNSLGYLTMRQYAFGLNVNF